MAILSQTKIIETGSLVSVQKNDKACKTVKKPFMIFE